VSDKQTPCTRLLLRAKELIDDALWQHIYDKGDHVAKNCNYSQWLTDCDRWLLGEEAEDD
jgi:hypothetical protein